MTATTDSWHIDGHAVSVSHPDKVLWPADGLTKRDMLEYYVALAPIMLAYFKGRPVTLRAFPGGIDSPGHYRRSIPGKNIPGISTMDYKAESSEQPTRLLIIDHPVAQIALANQGNIEFHLWSSRQPTLERPDQAILDLDPGERASFAQVRQAALLLRQVLDQAGLRSYPKTSGGRGLHLYVPLTPRYTFDAVHDWAHALAGQLVQGYPDLFALPSGGTHHGSHVTLDYIQNSVAHNTAAAYTLRALPGAPVSAPLTWQEVEQGNLEPADLTIRSIPARVKQIGDIFAPTLGQDQLLPEASLGS